MRRLVVIAVLGAGVICAPTLALADQTECEAVEAALRSAASYYGWSSEQVDAYVREGSASCWAEVRAEEQARAQQDAEVREATAREEAEEAARLDKKRRRDEQRRIRQREKDRQQARELRRHRREWRRKPTVTEEIARRFATRTLRKAGYEYAWTDCKGGRIDRIHWTCKVSLFVHCLRSRMLIWGAGYRDGQPWYGSQSGRFHPCRI
jgi:hypothetical protein